ncbi:hypothetical protein PV729_26685 [Streptomyces europaeiscabiei]|uniref:Uncharacterized protein n=1 Tax=Streptomyces europaeiscabiei TaxID=146819 RepID=A0ABU4NRF5_9ACTN|nr:hypothetical protein [Streptomyces europaeiscabiei]MDX2771446.1 hypothetical protein [Streptomyces europaeiscabiei]MDX3555310.1 hypothetical protein [Streptomyces europaeiscabiei]MDX3705324.1 hypothetical protein [Streptomyces europaeiscabiei]
MPTTTDIARTHGHTGPTNCQDCGTTESVHFGSWFDPQTRESGSFLQCCNCGIKAGDPIYTHAEDACDAPATRYVPNVNSDPHGQLAFKRIQERAIEAYIGGQHQATVLELAGREAEDLAIAAVLEAVGRAYAAAALNKAAQVLADKLDEETYLALGDVAATLDLDVVEDLDGANDTGEYGPEVRVFHRTEGWTMGGSPTPEPCTSNHFRQQDGRPACTAIAVWKVVEDHGLHLSIGFYCDVDLPAENRPAATV